MWIEIQTPDPHSESQRKIMGAFLNPHLRELVVACGTKYGKTLSAASTMIASAPLRRQGLYRWVAPIYSQSKIGFRYCQRMLPPIPWTIPNKSDMTLTLMGMETVLQFFHGQNAESLEGEASHGNVIDEAAKQKYEVYASVRTTTTQTMGPIGMFSTPKGKNWFYEKAMEARLEMERAAFEKREPRMLFITAPTSDNPFVPRESIEFARKTLPDRLFRQYYLAEFLDDGSVFVNVRECCYTDPISFSEWERHSWTGDLAAEKTVVIGADWGRVEDATAFFAIDIETGKVIGFDRFLRTSYTDAVKRLYLFCQRFKRVDIILHDKTGVGMAVDDLLAHTGLPYQGITFTNASKAEMVTRLMTAFEHRSIFIPRWNILLEELDSFEVKTNAIGLMSYSAASGKHDDTVCALMLANAALLQYGFKDSTVRFLEDLPKMPLPVSELEKYYQTIGGDDD